MTKAERDLILSLEKHLAEAKEISQKYEDRYFGAKRHIDALEAQLAQRDERIRVLEHNERAWIEHALDLAEALAKYGHKVMPPPADRLLAVPDAKEGEGK